MKFDKYHRLVSYNYEWKFTNVIWQHFKIERVFAVAKYADINCIFIIIIINIIANVISFSLSRGLLYKISKFCMASVGSYYQMSLWILFRFLLKI